MTNRLTRALVPVLICAGASFGCAGSRPAAPSTVPGHGAVSITIVPNPIVARQVSGGLYEFPFDAVVRETGGRAVTVTRITAHVTALGGIPVATETFDSSRIAALGYPTALAAGAELHYHFAPRKEVPDDRLFGSVAAELRLDATDDGGSPVTASATVTVRK